MLPTIPSVCCRTTLGKLKVRICGNLQKSNLKIVSRLTKTETSLIMAEYSHNSCAKTATPLIDCTVNDGLVNTMPNMQQTLLQFINVVHPRLTDSLLDDAQNCPYLVVDRVEVNSNF